MVTAIVHMSSVVQDQPEWCWQQLPWRPQALISNWRKEQNQGETERLWSDMGLGCLSKSAVAVLKTDGKSDFRIQESDSTDRSQRDLIITQPLFIHITFGLIWLFLCVTDKIKNAKIVFVVGKLNCLYCTYFTAQQCNSSTNNHSSKWSMKHEGILRWLPVTKGLE